jgi:hypothetical protein
MDLPIEFVDIRDAPRIERDGTVVVEKRVVFYVGKFGPFTEHFPVTLDRAEITTRVEALRSTLLGLPR